MAKLVLKKATLKDDHWLKETARSVNIFCYPSWFFRLLIFYNCLFLVTINKKRAGYVSFLPFRFFASAFILQIAILPDFQSKKFGGIILNKILNILRKKYHIRKIYLHTLKVRVRDWCRKQKYRVLVGVPSTIWILYKIHKEKIRKRKKLL